MADILPTRQAPNRIPSELLRDPRYAMSRALLQQGINTSEAGPIEALARLGTAYFGKSIGDDLNNDIKAKEAQTAETYARALSAGAGQQSVFDSKLNKWNDPTGEANPALMAKVLGSNPDTAPQGLALQLQNMTYNRDRGDKLVDQNTAYAQALGMKGLQQTPDGGVSAIPNFGQATGQIAADAARPMIGVDVAKQQALMPGVIQQAGGVSAASAQGALPSQMQLSQFNANQTLGNAQQMAQNTTSGNLAAQNAPVTIQGPNGPMQVPSGAAADIVKTQQTAPKMTDSQASAATYADRIAEASSILDDLESKNQQPGFGSAAVRGIPFVGDSLAANQALPETTLRYEQAQRDFVNAVLRRESGAVISPSEFDNAKRQYFPQPGDSPAIIEQKRKNRETSLNGIARAAGPAYRAPTAAAVSQPASAGLPALPPGFEPL